MTVLLTSLASWWRRNISDVDPNPTYSRLDRMDGLT
jgi:hypothetical protein